MSPLGLIPILEHNGEFINDSSVICAYLERLYPTNPIYPENPIEFAKALFLEEFADTALIEAVGTIFFQRFVRPKVFLEEGDEDIVKNALKEKLPPVFDFLEKKLSADTDTLVGTSFSIADAAVGNVLICMNLANEKIDTSQWPKLNSYHERLLRRPSFQKALPSSV